MLNAIIQFALRQRAIIMCLALAALVFGTMAINALPIDVLPSLTRPRVVVITECPGMAPEEVEREVTIPLEYSINGAEGIENIRSKSDVGLSVITVEFGWNQDIYRARQIVDERKALAQLPDGLEPRLGPISSLLGQIMLIGMWSETGETDPIAVREQADWVVKNRLRSISGVSEVITQGGGKKQYHVLVDVHLLHKYDVTLAEIRTALESSNLNVNGGYVSNNSEELLVRGIGRFATADQLKKIVVKSDSGRAILLENIATIDRSFQTMRGDSSINGFQGVVITIQKQPDADTRRLSEEIETAITELQSSLPPDVKIAVTYQQREFIDRSVHNVIEALVVGSLLVIVILFLFLVNFRTTIITMTAIPISIVITALVFKWFDQSINVMTLGGIAVALGELVDDAIVDVENIFRRLKENRNRANPDSIFKVIYEASYEVRNAIIISTIIVIVVFTPVFALAGLPGRLFAPLGIAYIVSIIASTVVSLTLTPVMSFYLLGKAETLSERKEGRLVVWLKKIVTPIINASLNLGTLLGMLFWAAILTVISVFIVMNLGVDFLPKFDEGATQLTVFASPGTSLETSTDISRSLDKQLEKLRYDEKDNPDGPFVFYTRKTGRAENDEHIMGVNTTEYTISLRPGTIYTRAQMKEILDDATKQQTNVEREIEQPIAHLISHLISGTTAEIAIKLYGDNLEKLAGTAEEIKAAIADMEGIDPPVVESQSAIPQLQIEPNYERLVNYKLNAQTVFDIVETAMQGRKVSTMVENERSFDVVLRFDEHYRTNVEELKRFPIELPDGGTIPLQSIASVRTYAGPNTINRDNARRRVLIRVNTKGRDLGSVVNEIQARIDKRVKMPEGYFVQIGGQYEAQQAASRRIMLLSLVALLVIIVILYSTYRSFNIVMQILIALPIALIGGVFGLWLTGQTMTIAAMVGFISLGGIAARNGLLLISAYLDQDEELGPDRSISREEIVRGSLSRMTPVLMTALTTGIALCPLILAGHLPGREILFPVATVIVGGLITSTVCEFLIRPGLFYHFGRGVSRE